jgi:ribosomal protein L37AE/L43A
VATPKPKTVRLSDEEWRLLKDVRSQLMNVGLRALATMEVNCPNCVETLEGAKLSSEEWKCSRCGYTQPGVQLGVEDGALTLGAVSATGMVALLGWLRQLSQAPAQ